MAIPRRILAATDFSECGTHAVGAAATLALRFGAELHLVHALEVPIPLFEPYAVAIPATYVADVRRSATEKLNGAMAALHARGLSGTAQLGETPAAPAIVDRAREVGADWIVVGTHGHTGLKHMLLGSVAERTVKEAECPVLTVKTEHPEKLPHLIMVAMDFSPEAEEAMKAAEEIAAELGAGIRMVHALDLGLPLVTPYEIALPEGVVEAAQQEAESRLEEMARRARAPGGVAAEVRSGPTHVALAEAASEAGADLIITGSRGLTGIKHALLGSVAERTLRHAPCSVLTLKH
jgi:nucleotide-binding universal stress UspA family protein